jgi:hypothetical protein
MNKMLRPEEAATTSRERKVVKIDYQYNMSAEGSTLSPFHPFSPDCRGLPQLSFKWRIRLAGI